MMRTIRFVNGLTSCTVLTDHAQPFHVTSAMPSGLLRCVPLIAAAKMPPKSSPVMSAWPTARRWTMCLPISIASEGGNSPRGYGPLRRLVRPFSLGSFDMQDPFDNRPDHRHRHGVPGLLAGLAAIGDYLERVGESLKPQHLSRRKSPLAVDEKIVVRRARAQRARERMA